MAVVNPIRKDTVAATTVTWTLGVGDTGAAIDLSDFEFNKAFHVFSSGAGTAQLTRSNDGVNFVNWGSTLAANTMNDFQTAAKYYAVGAVATAGVTVTISTRKLVIKA